MAPRACMCIGAQAELCRYGTWTGLGCSVIIAAFIVPYAVMALWRFANQSEVCLMLLILLLQPTTSGFKTPDASGVFTTPDSGPHAYARSSHNQPAHDCHLLSSELAPNRNRSSERAMLWRSRARIRGTATCMMSVTSEFRSSNVTSTTVTPARQSSLVKRSISIPVHRITR